MSFPTQVLPDHHRHCDDLFVVAEDSAQRGDWAAAEEDLLFPAFEAATGMSAGPTQIMRHEHEQMRSLLSQLSLACQAHDDESYAGVAETLLMLMQQHNMKEENILYPMCDQALGAQAQALGARIGQTLETGHA
jgi:hemerythrin-like domain-containing protein